MTEGLVFLPSYYDAIRELPDAERLMMYDAIVQYGIEGELPELPPILNAAFLFCKPNIDSSKGRYADAVENGKKGGRPRTKAKQEPTLASAPELEPVLTVDPEENPVQEIAKPAFASENPASDFTKPAFDFQNPVCDFSDDPFYLQNQEKDKDKDKDKEMDKETDREMDKETDRDSEKDREIYRGRESTERRAASATPSAKRFLPPSVEEVRDFCQERGSRVDAQRFVDFYTAKGWRIGKDPMKDWKAAVRTWEQRDKENFRDITSPDRYTYEEWQSL